MKNDYCLHNPFYYYHSFRLQSDNNLDDLDKHFLGEKGGNESWPKRTSKRISSLGKSRKQNYCFSLPLQVIWEGDSLQKFIFFQVSQKSQVKNLARYDPAVKPLQKAQMGTFVQCVTFTSPPNLAKILLSSFTSSCWGLSKCCALFPPYRRRAGERIPMPLCLPACTSQLSPPWLFTMRNVIWPSDI